MVQVQGLTPIWSVTNIIPVTNVDASNVPTYQNFGVIGWVNTAHPTNPTKPIAPGGESGFIGWIFNTSWVRSMLLYVDCDRPVEILIISLNGLNQTERVLLSVPSGNAPGAYQTFAIPYPAGEPGVEFELGFRSPAGAVSPINRAIVALQLYNS